MASLSKSVQSKDHDKLDRVSNVKLQKEDFKLRNDESEREEGDNLNEGGQKLVDQVDEGGQAQHEGGQQQDTTTNNNNNNNNNLSPSSRPKSFMMSLSNVNEEEVQDEDLQRGASEATIDDF